MQVLWDSQRWNVQFLYNKFNPPVIDDGQIYVPNYKRWCGCLSADAVGMGVPGSSPRNRAEIVRDRLIEGVRPVRCRRRFARVTGDRDRQRSITLPHNDLSTDIH